MNEHQWIISPEWLAAHLDTPNQVVIDCRFRLNDPQWGKKQYQISHIPGAYYLDLDADLSSPVEKHGGRHPFPDPNSLAKTLEAIGITWGETLVIAYDDFRFAFAARLWGLLRYFGHTKTALLDGGWNQWIEGGYPVTAQLPPPKKGHFVPQLQEDWIVDIEAVKAKKDLDSVILLDSREGDRYRGEQEPIDPIAGHIPGALNSPWKLVSDEKGYFYPLEAQKDRWEAYEKAEEIIVYCGSGVTACVNLLSLEMAGYKNAKLYPGGWSDWCSYLIHTPQ